MKRQQWDGEHRHEPVDPGALLRREDPPPPDGAVRQNHGHVERHDRRENIVYILATDHLQRKWKKNKQEQVKKKSNTAALPSLFHMKVVEGKVEMV